MSQQTISIFSRGNKTLIETTYTIGPRFDETDSNGVRRIGYRAGTREFVQTGIHPGGGKTPAGTKLGYYIEGAPEQVIWTLRPDGSATLERKFSTPTFGREGMPGTPEYTYNFSAEGLKVFRMVASQFPDGIIERGISVNGLKWPAWDFPFTATDSANMRAWVISLTPADAFAIYYNLLAYDGKEFSRCTYRKFNPSVSPAEFEVNWFWPVFQDMVAMSIYNIRTDLHKVRDPETGEIIDGLIKYDLFRMPCKPGPGEIVFQVIASTALAVVTAGAGAALAASLKTISFAKSIHDMKEGADKAKAQAAFTNSVVRGFQSGVQIENILTPAPMLTPEEQKLIERASGETKSPTETSVVAGEAVKGSGIPWLLLAGAAAALLS
jgi:hypothetical protein